MSSGQCGMNGQNRAVSRAKCARLRKSKSMQSARSLGSLGLPTPQSTLVYLRARAVQILRLQSGHCLVLVFLFSSLAHPHTARLSVYSECSQFSPKLIKCDLVDFSSKICNPLAHCLPDNGFEVPTELHGAKDSGPKAPPPGRFKNKKNRHEVIYV